MVPVSTTGRDKALTQQLASPRGSDVQPKEPMLGARQHPPQFVFKPLILMFLLFGILRAPAQTTQSPNFMQIDASGTSSEAQPSEFQGGSAVSPSGQSIGVNSRYLTLNGKPWLPVMGEFHYSRYPENRWEEEILKLKASGVQIVATYVLWIHQEEVEGKFDWSGQRDLKRFVEICAKHGMYVYPRIGPWAHGEARNGGFPDWLVASVKSPRSNDPRYLAYVERYYSEIAHQLNGLLWKNGGPIIGIQLENEYSSQGPGRGEEHIRELKKIAIQSGLDVPIYSVTGWDNAAVPSVAVLPVFGGYPDAPWSEAIQQLPPNEVYTFRFGSRVSGDMGAMGAKQQQFANKSAVSGYPFLTAEIGGGMQDTYHRRPVVSADDIAAMCPVMLGSGVNLYGLYMFQGGQNPDGKLSTLQESQTTGYPNDVPVKSYDFQAPLGEFGEERGSFRKLKLVSYFLNDFGSGLAPMIAHAPSVLPKGAADFSVPRVSVRASGDQGFIFLNNHVRDYPMPERIATQLQIKLPDETLLVPRSPINIPTDSYFIWPFNLDLGGVNLKYSTAQLFTEIEDTDTRNFIFFAIPGIAPEFAFESADLAPMKPSTASVTRLGDIAYVTAKSTGFDSPLKIHTKFGKTIRVFVIDQSVAENTWKVKIDGKQHLLISADQFFADEDHIHLQATGHSDFSFRIFPPLKGLAGNRPIRLTGVSGETSSFAAALPERVVALRDHKLCKSSEVPPVMLGPAVSWRTQRVAQAPDDLAFDKAAKWLIDLPPNAMNGLSELFLNVEYLGDVGRLLSGDHLLEDNFYNGLPWSVGLSRFLAPGKSASLTLSILPLRADAPIYLESRYRPIHSDQVQWEELTHIKLVPQYELLLKTNIANP